MTDENPWAEIVGPCYTVTSMARTLGWTEAEVMKAANDLQLLMLHTDDDVDLFPAFQLQDGKIVDGLQDILRVLETGTTGKMDVGAVVERRTARRGPATQHHAALRGAA
ncbi:hypothetical protein ACIQTX_14535 [Microbacterium sp. NPDC090281]|uniref:hypothetical protein n=1 Tax=Microbacterium sp. NPDC090281 TaxID=3364208 RepID=UPI0038064EF6